MIQTSVPLLWFIISGVLSLISLICWLATISTTFSRVYQLKAAHEREVKALKDKLTAAEINRDTARELLIDAERKLSDLQDKTA